jgi:hypothetical protein
MATIAIIINRRKRKEILISRIIIDKCLYVKGKQQEKQGAAFTASKP